jgi:hypothetical protein
MPNYPTVTVETFIKYYAFISVIKYAIDMTHIGGS